MQADGKRKLTRRRFLSLMGGMSGAVLLAACAPQAGQAPSSPTQASQPPAATAAPEPTQAPAATAAPAATTAPAATEAPSTGGAAGQIKKLKGQIVISTNGAGEPTAHYGFDSLIAAYNKYQPDVKVLYEGPPQGTDYTTWLGTQLAAGTPRPDIVSGNYQTTYAKYANLDKWRFQPNPYTGNKWDEDLDWNFYVERMANGGRRMLATEAVHIMWFYNKDLLAKAGAEPPKTWDEMVDVCDKLQKAGITPIASNFIWKVPQWILEIYNDQYNRGWTELYRAQSGDYNYDEELDGKFKFDPNDPFIEAKYNTNPTRFWKAVAEQKIRYDTPEIAEMVKNLAKVFPKYASKNLYIDTGGGDYSEFLQQQVAMIIDGTWSLPGLDRDMKNLDKLTADRLKSLKIQEGTKLQPFAWGTFENPAMTGPLVKFGVRSIESASGVYASFIDKTAEQTDLDADFLMFWYSREGYQAWIDGYVKSPEGYNAAGPVMVKGVTLPPETEAMMKGIKMMGNAEQANGYMWPTYMGNVQTLQKQAFDLYKNALDGKITPEDFGKQLEKLNMDNLDEMLKQSGLTRDDLQHPERAPSH